MSIEFVIPGEAVGKGRPRAFRMGNGNDAEIVRHMLSYNPDSGAFRWIAGARAGQPAGTIRARGNKGKRYVQVGLCGMSFYAHRLAWLHAHGEWPSGEIDHINGDGLDNRLSNLRVVAHADNNRNQRLHKTNSTGVAGVSWSKCAGKWLARISSEGKTKYLGVFEKFDDAVAARRAAETEHGYHQNHGTERAL